MLLNELTVSAPHQGIRTSIDCQQLPINVNLTHLSTTNFL